MELSRQHYTGGSELLHWYVPRLVDTFQVPYVVRWLPDGPADEWVATGAPDCVDDQWLGQVDRLLKARGVNHASRRGSVTSGLLDQLAGAGADLVIRGAGEMPALFVFGKWPLGPGLGDEEFAAAKLLVEHFCVMRRNRALQEKTILAERQAMQGEKLKTLGMLSSCMAHEVKNPLSTIKTIASLLREQLGERSEHAEDLKLIVSEVDRLSQRTNELLGFARPANVGQACESLSNVVLATTSFLTHRARQRGVEVEVVCDDNLAATAIDENALREILFNLIGNAIDAATHKVTVTCRSADHSVICRIHDDGDGISPEMQATLFEPFETTKADGTGLGLYIVRRRIEEMGGEIRLTTAPSQGTEFTVELNQESLHGARFSTDRSAQS